MTNIPERSLSIRRFLLVAAAILSFLGAPGLAWAGQLVAERPAVEVGARVSALATSNNSAVLGTPQVSWNLDPKTAIEGSADFRNATYGLRTEHLRVGYVQLKRTLFMSPAGAGRLFATAGGAAGWSRTVFPSYTTTFRGVTAVVPSTVYKHGFGGFSVGAGFDRVLNAHLLFSVESQFVMSPENAIFRTLVGLSTPIGRYKRQPAPSPASAAALGGINVGQTVWVTMNDATVWKGIVVDVSTNSVALRGSGVTTALPIERIKRIEGTDSVVDGLRRGAAIGATAGIPAGILAAAICVNEGGDCGAAAIVIGLAWSGVGAGIGAVAGAIADSLHEGRRTVYEAGPTRVAIAPIVAPHAAGLGAVIRW